MHVSIVSSGGVDVEMWNNKPEGGIRIVILGNGRQGEEMQAVCHR
jgi:hypothetical protein